LKGRNGRQEKALRKQEPGLGTTGDNLPSAAETFLLLTRINVYISQIEKHFYLCIKHFRHMKKLATLFAVVLTLTVSMAMKALEQAEFKFEKETHDFGKIPAGKPVTYEFKFVNVGDEPIIIKGVEASCGCTVPEYSSAPVKKGDTGSIKVTYNAAAVMPFNKVITIKSNAKTSVKYLYIKGEVVSAASSQSN
jgi:hypothetical protein